MCFLAEANERLIWVYEGEAERGAVRGCLGYGEEVKTGCWERGPFIGLLLAEVGERERLPWMEICRGSKENGGSLVSNLWSFQKKGGGGPGFWFQRERGRRLVFVFCQGRGPLFLWDSLRFV